MRYSKATHKTKIVFEREQNVKQTSTFSCQLEEERNTHSLLFQNGSQDASGTK